MRVFSALLGILFITAVGLSEADEREAPALPVNDFKGYARLLLERHPDIKSLEAVLAAAEQIPDYAHSLTDPRLKLSVANLPFGSCSFSREAMTQKQIGIIQDYPAFGKRDQRRKVAEDSIRIAAEQIPEKRLELIEKARVASYMLKYLQEARDIVIKNRDILDGFVKIALTKYSVGRGLQQNVLQAQVEVSKMTDILTRIEQGIRSTGDLLATMADLPIDADWSSFEIEPLPPINGAADALLETALKKRPIFRMLEMKIEKAEDTAELARLDILPDYSFSVAYGQRDAGPAGDRDDLVSASVTLTIPAWLKTRQEKKIAESAMLAESARHEFTSEEWKLRYQIADLLDIEKKNMDLIVLYDTGLLPQASQTVESSLSAYEVNKVDFLTLVTNQVALFNFEIERSQIFFELQSARARMSRAIGENSTGEF